MNYEILKQTCLSQIEDFAGLGEVIDTPDGIYIYRNNPRAKILGVAHLDTVLALNHFHLIDIGGDDTVINAQLDDRLGVYTLLYLLPALGIEFDLLLTEGEESGRSTAAHFKATKDYNWIFSFDRRGEDVVLYKYEDKSITEPLKASGFKIGTGSFSDIVFLEHLGVKGFNVGTGYFGEHNDMCYANIPMLERQTERFLEFYLDNQDVHFPHVPHVPTIKAGKGGQWTKWNGKTWDYKSYEPENVHASAATWSKGTLESTGYDGQSCDMCGHGVGKHAIADIWLCGTCYGQVEICPSCGDIVYSDEVMNNKCYSCEQDD